MGGTDQSSLLVEVKKTRNVMSKAQIQKFLSLCDLFQKKNPSRQMIAGFLSLCGFAKGALALGQQHGIGTAEDVNHLQTDWS